MGVLATIAVAAGWFLRGRSLEAVPVLPRRPEVVLPSPNGYDYYLQAGQMVTVPPFMTTYPHPKAPTAQDAAVIASDAPALAVLRRGLALPVGVPPVEASRFTAGSRLRSLSRTLSTKAMLEIAAGRWDAAAQTSEDDLQFGATQARGGALIQWLVGIACSAMGRKTAWDTVDHVSRVEAVAAAHRALAIEAARTTLSSSLTADKFYMIGLLADGMRAPGWRQGLFGTSGEETTDSRSLMARVQSMSKQDVVDAIDKAYDRIIPDASNPYEPGGPPPIDDPIGNTLAPNDGAILFRDVEDSAGNRLLAVAYALQAYRLDHGGYPDGLAELSPRYLPTIPTDPFADDRPFHYKRRGSSYLLYSVGPDGIDDGGKPCPPTSPTATSRYVNQDSKGDIVVGVNTI